VFSADPKELVEKLIKKLDGQKRSPRKKKSII